MEGVFTAQRDAAGMQFLLIGDCTNYLGGDNQRGGVVQMATLHQLQALVTGAGGLPAYSGTIGSDEIA
jgi:hypothetical protein